MEIFQRLPMKEILTMRRVSTRMKMVAREREIWKGVVISSSFWREGLYYDNGDEEPTGRKLADLNTVTREELAWLVCRARVAEINTNAYLEKIPDILHNIVEERQEEIDLLDLQKRRKIVLLESIDMRGVDFSDVDSQLLANAVVRVKSVNMDTEMSTDQINTLCRTIIEVEERVKKLESINISYVDLSDVDSQVLASAFVRVKSVVISHTHLKTNQVNTLCRTIIEEEERVSRSWSIST